MRKLIQSGTSLILLLVILTACKKNDPSPDQAFKVHNDFFETYKNQSILLDVLENDEIGTDYTINFALPLDGSIEYSDNNTILYKPKYGFLGTEMFTYEVCNSEQSLCRSGKVTVEVKSIGTNCNLQFQAHDDVLQLESNTTLIFVISKILSQDQGCSGDISSEYFEIKTQPGNGTLVRKGQFLHYKPNNNYKGTDRFDYTITSVSNALIHSEATVFLEVQ